MFVLALLVILGAGTACRKRGTATDVAAGKTLPVSETKCETGWPLYEVAAEGFAVELPPGWRRFEMDPKTFEAKFQDTLKQNPQLEPMLANLRQQVAAGVKFFGFDVATKGPGIATNVNILVLPVLPGGTLDSTAADTGWSDSHVSWPRCQKRGLHGGSGLLVDEDLERAIRPASTTALKVWFGVSNKAVWNWRNAFGVLRMDNLGSRRLIEAASIKRGRGNPDTSFDHSTNDGPIFARRVVRAHRSS